MSEPFTVLLVEDSGTDRIRAREAILAVDASTRVLDVPKVDEAFSRLAVEKIDCLLLGHQTEWASAPDLAGAISRARLITPDAAIVALCDSVDPAATSDLYTAGADEIVARNDRFPAVIYGAIRCAVRVRRAERSARSTERKLVQSLRNTHHHLRNSLQMIAAMMDLRLAEHTDRIGVEDYRQLARHIHSLSVVHDLLMDQAQTTSELETLSASKILERLLPLLQEVAGVRLITLTADDIELTPRQADALPLVVNELVSNAIQHGGGPVEMLLEDLGHEARLVIRDHGAGFPEGFDVRRDSHSGLELVERLSRWDLKGLAEYGAAPEGGGCASIRFPYDRHET